MMAAAETIKETFSSSSCSKKDVTKGEDEK